MEGIIWLKVGGDARLWIFFSFFSYFFCQVRLLLLRALCTVYIWVAFFPLRLRVLHAIQGYAGLRMVKGSNQSIYPAATSIRVANTCERWEFASQVGK